MPLRVRLDQPVSRHVGHVGHHALSTNIVHSGPIMAMLGAHTGFQVSDG
jgi:hypothetical protein